MYSTRMHPHDAHEDYNTLWWITPALIILALLVAATLTFDQDETASLTANEPATAMEPTILYDSAKDIDDEATHASPSFGVPDASTIVARRPELENSHAPTF